MMGEEMEQGYRDGREPNSPEPSDNRSHRYRHGFANGRDDLNRSPRASADVLREVARAAEIKDKERDLISERTKAGIAAHKARGGRMGKKHFVKDYPLRMARWVELWPLIHDGGLTGPEVIAEMNAADPDATPVKTPQSFYNWRAEGYPGFTLDTPLDEVEIDDE